MKNEVFKDTICKYVCDNYAKDITLGKAASDIGFSSFYLSKLIKENLDVTYVNYLTQVRIEKAKALLEEEQFNISEVANAVGYAEPKYFSNVFKKFVGMTPSAYRRSVQEVQMK